jgi:hypothetical protein
MFGKQHTRRQVIASAGAAGALGVLGSATALINALPAHAATEVQSNAIVGTWLSTVTVEGPNAPAPYGAIFVMNSSGTVVNSNARERLNMVGAQYGSWVANADGTVAFVTIGFRYDAKGNPAGTRESHLSIRVGPTGNTGTGSVTVYTKDLAGKVLATTKASFASTRVVVK